MFGTFLTNLSNKGGCGELPTINADTGRISYEYFNKALLQKLREEFPEDTSCFTPSSDITNYCELNAHYEKLDYVSDCLDEAGIYDGTVLYKSVLQICDYVDGKFEDILKFVSRNSGWYEKTVSVLSYPLKGKLDMYKLTVKSVKTKKYGEIQLLTLNKRQERNDRGTTAIVSGSFLSGFILKCENTWLNGRIFVRPGNQDWMNL